MAFCRNCGNQLADGALFCNKCGTKVAAAPQASSAQPASAQPVNQQYSYDNASAYVSTNDAAAQNKGKAIISLIFGIVALLFAILSWYPFACFFFFPAAIVFLCIAKAKRNAYIRNVGQDNGMAKAGNICATIAIPVGIVMFIIGFYVSVFVGTLAALL